MNSGSLRYRAYCSRNSSSARISVSATNTPPYGPKWPRSSGRSYTLGRSAICIAHSLHELSDACVILQAAPRPALGPALLDAGGNVDRPWTQRADRLLDV